MNYKIYRGALNTLVFLICIGLGTISCSLNRAVKNDGFVKLFNGKNFNDWDLKIRNGDSELAKKVYAIENGMVHVYKDFPDTIDLNTGENKTHGLFFTKKSYSKYILKFEYKWGAKIANNFDQFQYDAGVYYHVFDNKIWPKGIEYQIRFDHLNNKNHSGDFWATWVQIQWYAKDGAFMLPKNGGTKQPLKKQEHVALINAKFNALNDKWNTCEIIVMGNEYVIHKLNGVIVNLATNLSKGEGVIGFQSETAEIFYRNIKIKEFDKMIPMDEFIK